MTYHLYIIGEDELYPYINSYVGVTNNMDGRWKNHLVSKHLVGKTIRERGWSRDNMRSIFSGSAKECFAFENALRPNPSMGLNIACGGYGGHTSYTPERNKKISEKLKGRKNTWVTPEAFKDRDFSREKNPNAKHWELTDPGGNTISIVGTLTKFCNENDLLESCLRRHTGVFVPEPQFSGYGGFRAKNDDSLRRRLNTTQWRLQLLSST